MKTPTHVHNQSLSRSFQLIITASTLGLLSLTACMSEEEIGQGDDETAVDDQSVSILPDIITPESIRPFVDEERWVDGLEELLDPVCDEEGCRWAWTETDDALEEIYDLLPEVPEGFDPPTPAHSASVVPPPAAAGKKLTITSIRCIDTQEFGSDEPFILINGKPFWSFFNVVNGMTIIVNKSYTYTVSADLELYEDDPNWDDLMGSREFAANEPIGPDYTLITGAGGTYKIYYTISNV